MDIETLREKVKSLLEDGTVTRFWGYAEGFDSYHPVPFLVRRPEDTDRLIFNHFCSVNLSKYLLEHSAADGRTGILAKGCDAVGVDRMLKDHRVDREKVYILGVPCPTMLRSGDVQALGAGNLSGVEDRGDKVALRGDQGSREVAKKDYLEERCLTCDHKNPLLYDELLGEAVDDTPLAVQEYAAVREIEKLDPQQRREYWEKQFARCIRCNACRNICPACNCRVCVFDMSEPRWVWPAKLAEEQQMFHFIRAVHVAGRCTDCGLCEKVCPVNIPLMRMNRKIQKDIGDLFEIEKPYLPMDVEPLGSFLPEDPDEFN